MIVLEFVINLLSGAMLLLYGVKLFRTGLQGQFGASIRRQLGDAQPKSALMARGAVLGFAMQGGTAVLLMTAGLAQTRVISVATAILIALGAEFGSALAVKFLSAGPSGIGPLLILVGGWLLVFARGAQKKRDFGSLILGLGLVFLALSLLRQTSAPIANSDALNNVVLGLGADTINAVLLGLVLTLAMHSSLVALLTAATLLIQTDLSSAGLLAFVLGCNLGSALLPVWLLKQDGWAARSVAAGVGTLRGILAAILLGALSLWPSSLTPLLSGMSPSETLIYGHLAFNAVLLLSAVFAPRVAGFLSRQSAAAVGMKVPYEQLEGAPHLALADIKRHINTMLEALGEMVDAATGPQAQGSVVRETELRLNAEFKALREKFADLPVMPTGVEDDIRLLLDFSTRVERSGDILSTKYLSIRDEEREGVFCLTNEGRTELSRQLAEVKAAVALSQHVFWKQDPFEARALIEQKQAIADMELEHRQNHFSRLRQGGGSEHSSSDQYLEMIAILKEVASKVATIGYIVLDQHGGLKKSRLTSLKKLKQSAGDA